MPGPEFIDQLRTELPRLLREHPEVRHEVLGLILEAVPSRQEFATLLEEIRISREESNRRFEAMDRRFEAVDRRFEEMRSEMNQRFDSVDRRSRRSDYWHVVVGEPCRWIGRNAQRGGRRVCRREISSC